MGNSRTSWTFRACGVEWGCYTAITLDRKSVRRSLAAAEQELERVAQLTRQTLGFYRESSAPEDFDLAALLENVVAIYRPKFVDRKLEVSIENHGTQLVRGVAGEIRQVLSNLLVNAMDASRPGHCIYVRVRTYRLREGLTTCLTIGDSGEGIAPENIGRIFEPFFTTKRSVGTGLGLWLCKQIVERHRGKLRVRSRKSRGTVFALFLPGQTTGNG